MQIIKPGKQMQVQYPIAKLFIEGDASIKLSAVPLFDRIIVALSNRPNGVRHDMEFVISGPKNDSGIMPIEETLEIKRLGAFAREMMGRGIPPDAISVGLTPAISNDATILFYTRDENETKVEFINNIPVSDVDGVDTLTPPAIEPPAELTPETPALAPAALVTEPEPNNILGGGANE